MENIVFQIPSGITVTFKPYLTHGQKRQLSRFMSAKMTVDPVTKEGNTLIDGATMMDAQDMALKLMLVSVQLPDGLKTGDEAFSAVQDMTDADGNAVYNKLDEISTATSDEDKKKLNSNSSSSSNPVEG